MGECMDGWIDGLIDRTIDWSIDRSMVWSLFFSFSSIPLSNITIKFDISCKEDMFICTLINFDWVNFTSQIQQCPAASLLQNSIKWCQSMLECLSNHRNQHNKDIIICATQKQMKGERTGRRRGERGGGEEEEEKRGRRGGEEEGGRKKSRE